MSCRIAFASDLVTTAGGITIVSDRRDFSMGMSGAAGDVNSRLFIQLSDERNNPMNNNGIFKEKPTSETGRESIDNSIIPEEEKKLSSHAKRAVR